MRILGYEIRKVKGEAGSAIRPENSFVSQKSRQEKIGPRDLPPELRKTLRKINRNAFFSRFSGGKNRMRTVVHEDSLLYHEKERQHGIFHRIGVGLATSAVFAGLYLYVRLSFGGLESVASDWKFVYREGGKIVKLAPEGCNKQGGLQENAKTKPQGKQEK